MPRSSISKNPDHLPTYQLPITEKIIARGVTRNSNHCMVAEGLKEVHPELKSISVDIQTIRASDPNRGKRYIWITPKAIQRLIVDFDAGRPIKPFRTTLRDGQVVDINFKKSRGIRINKTNKKAKLSHNRGYENTAKVPHKVGGSPPPKGIGSRRQFGLRNLVY